MKKIILILVSGMFFLISNSYSQMFGGSIFKNKDKIDLEKFINLDITKYNSGEFKKIIGQDYKIEDKIVDNKKITTYKIFLTNDGNEYELILTNKDDKFLLFLNLISDDKKLVPNFKSCSSIKDKYSKKFGKQFRYKNIPQTKETAFEFLKFQLNFSNHTIELSCTSIGETQLLTYVINKSKKDSVFMGEVAKITCSLNKMRIEHHWKLAGDSGYFVTKNIDQPTILNLYIDEYSKKIGRFSNGNFLDIHGNYKIFTKDKIEVIEDKEKGNSITWLIDRITGGIETYTIRSDSETLDQIVGGIGKSRRFGTCQKTKDNAF